MAPKRCLYCYQLLEEKQVDFHPNCSKKIFGSDVPPEITFSKKDLLGLAEKVIRSKSAITGVQPKLSLEIVKPDKKSAIQKLSIVGVYGQYILKPQTDHYPHLPELEDVTMHLASIAGIRTVPHSLIRLKAGSLAYITKRIDRTRNGKLHMEDMCQLTERLTEHKYRGSYEQIGNNILKFSNGPGLDLINFFEIVVFSFLTGNNDMHLKNFSLIEHPGLGYSLSWAYDLVASSLVVEGDDEELALNLNGKKKKLRKADFDQFYTHFDIPKKSIENSYKRFAKSLPLWQQFIEISFLPKDLKVAYNALILERAQRLQLI